MYAYLDVDVGVLHLEGFISIPAPSHNVSRELQFSTTHQIKQCSLGCILSTGDGDAGITVQQFYEDKIINYVSYKNRVWSMRCNSSPHFWANPTIHLTEYTYRCH